MLRCSLFYLKIAQTSEKYQACLNIFPGEVQPILSKDSAKLRVSECNGKLVF